MISKLLLLTLSITALATLVVAVLSFTAETELACVDLGQSDWAKSHFLVEDWAFAEWCGVPPGGQKPPAIQGLILLYHDLEQGARNYVQARRGSLIIAFFELRTSDDPRITTRTGLGGVAVERDWIDGPPRPCGIDWSLVSEEQIQWLRRSYVTVHAVRMPLWLLFVFCVTCPTVAFVRGPLRRWRRNRRGFCLKCGYNLTGNISGTCPECGCATRLEEGG